MRFLCYNEAGGDLAPHVDLARTDPLTGVRSTHTFLLYLRDCATGGETALRKWMREPCVHTACSSLAYPQPKAEGMAGSISINFAAAEASIAKVAPRRGRLLVFPHLCPHEGCEVVSTPKILLRGELV